MYTFVKCFKEKRMNLKIMERVYFVTILFLKQKQHSVLQAKLLKDEQNLKYI